MVKRSAPMSQEARAAHREIRKGLDRLARSIKEIRIGLRKTERRIEADARRRIRALRAEARAQLAVLQSRQGEVARRLRRLADAAGGSWQEIKQAADGALANARTVAQSVATRFQEALQK
jgi:hypothetical protein